MGDGAMTKEYLVEWRIELTAKNPRDAARKALAIQRDSSSIATVFDVWGDLDNGEMKTIDLSVDG